MELVFLCIALGLFTVAYWGVMRYNLHMFQLNGYKNKEHSRWLGKNFKNQLILWCGIVPGFLLCMNGVNVWGAILVYLIFAGYIVYYFNLRRKNVKKKTCIIQKHVV